MNPAESECPSDVTVTLYLDGALCASERSEMLAHLGSCDACRRLVAEFASSACAPEPVLRDARRGRRPIIPLAPGEVSPRAAPANEPAAPSTASAAADKPADAGGGDPEAPVGGRYQVRRILGAGGMGTVYAAYDPELEREVALKVLAPASLTGRRSQAQLLKEARSAAHVSHPNVVAIYDVGSSGGRIFVAMELVAGPTLRGWLETPRPWQEIVRLFLQAGEGLAAVHAAGLIHCDFKPENVLVGRDGRVRLGDFGLAREVCAPPPAASLASIDVGAFLPSNVHASLFAGTPRYVAPEVYEGQCADARSDQYGFCVALWEALHGEAPFARAGVAPVPPAIDLAPPEPPRGGTFSRAVLPALRRGLSRDPAERFPSMPALLDALGGTRPGRRGVRCVARDSQVGLRRGEQRRNQACVSAQPELATLPDLPLARIVASIAHRPLGARRFDLQTSTGLAAGVDSGTRTSMRVP